MKRIENENYLDVTELATYLGLTETTIRNYIHNGKIKGQKIGKSWYAKESAVKAFFAPTNQELSLQVLTAYYHTSQTFQTSDIPQSFETSDIRDTIKMMMQLILESPETNKITSETFLEILKHVRAIAELIKNPKFDISSPALFP